MSDECLPAVTVLPPGTSVTVGGSGDTADTGVPARILAVKITPSGVEYLVSWWSDRTHYTEWFDERSGVVCDGGAKRQAIGFTRKEGDR